PDKMTEKVFDIFQTGKNGQENLNSGVGLAIVKKLVGKMGGTIWIDSDYSQGARFILSLPTR
ncbi:MAG: ATP-binding protein, partial [Cyclobacteriaceae bacterium]|nr:ATP-binding protein [Cyclobacteriaceae bacterium]